MKATGALWCTHSFEKPQLPALAILGSSEVGGFHSDQHIRHHQINFHSSYGGVMQICHGRLWHKAGTASLPAEKETFELE